MQDESRLIEKIAEVVGGHAGARLAYGDPVERDGTTVVPVARVRFGFGGGGGQKPGEAPQQGGGGGGGAVVTPAGFLIMTGHAVSFRPIRDPARTIGLVLAIGLGLRIVLSGLAWLRS